MNSTFHSLVFVLLVVLITLSIVINNMLVTTCGIFLSWWAGITTVMLIWAIVYPLLEKKYLVK